MVDGAVLGQQAFVLRYFGSLGDERLLLVNFGRAFHPEALAEPLLAPPAGHRFATLWSSEAARYGGPGEVPLETEKGWQIPAEAGVAFSPAPLPDET